MTIKHLIGIVGTGVMGRGIAQLFVQSGHSVLIFDNKPGAAADARAFVLNMIDRRHVKGELATEIAHTAAARLAIADSLSELTAATVIVEAILEDISAKQSLFRTLEDIVDNQAILASNTSSLTVTAIAAACRTPARVAGLHFFNPVPLMKIAEVISGLLTHPTTVDFLETLVQSCGHRTVRAADQPGFLINHAGRGLYTEGFRIIEESVADYATVDRVLRECCGFRMGPFELLDLTGLDVSGKVMQSMYEQFYHDPRYRPSVLVPPRIAAGLLGRKVGKGFYTYVSGTKTENADLEAPKAQPGRIWIQGVDTPREITQRLSSAGAELLSGPDGADAILIRPWGDDIATAAARDGLDPSITVAIDPLIAADRRQVLMVSPATAPRARDLVHGWLAADRSPVSVIADSPGFIAQRVLAMIVNISCEIAQRAIAVPSDIDDAARIGLGYPSGPLALGDAMGGTRVLTILETLQAITGDPRYRPSLWLRRRAKLGLSLQTSREALE